MAKNSVLDILYSEEKSPLEFHFDNLGGPFVHMFFTEQECMQIYEIASSDELAGDVRKKKQMIDNIVARKGFKRKWSGTNRLIYTYMEDYTFLLKIAFDNTGMSDSLREYENQFYLKPFCVKIFDVHRTGILATVERVVPIRTITEFIQVADNVYDLITNKIIGKYVLDDIGCLEFFQNYGVRKGFGTVLLDFPYMYKLDGNKLFCSQKDRATGHICHGEIDYDETFDNLICTKCGKKYFARDLKEDIEKEIIYVEGDNKMSKVFEIVNGQVRRVVGGHETDHIVREERYIPPSQKQLNKGFIPMEKKKIMFSNEVELQTIEDTPTIGEELAAKMVTRNEVEKEVEVKKETVDFERSTFIPPLSKQKSELSSELHFNRGTIDAEPVSESTDDYSHIPKFVNELDLSKLGEVISENQIDEEEDFSKFGITDKDFEEPNDEEYNELLQTEYYEDMESKEKIIKNKKSNYDNDNLY